MRAKARVRLKELFAGNKEMWRNSASPCINKSDHPTVIDGKAVYLGLGYIKELETKTVQQIIENRQFFGALQILG